MERVLEPELMDDWARAKAYAESDFSIPHNAYVARFQELFPDFQDKPWGTQVVDLGCGNADPTIRFARAFPRVWVHGMDGSHPMIYLARIAVINTRDVMIDKRISFKETILPKHPFPAPSFDAVISNSLLHHLKDPQILWQTVKELALPNAPIFVMDLIRPESKDHAIELVIMHSEKSDPELMREDFYNSLLAAFEPQEVEEQLKKAHMDYLHVEVVDEYHMMIHGRSA